MDTSTLHPWPVLRSILLELSSYEVPKIVDRAGLVVDWSLSSQKDYSDKMRIAAYRPRIDSAYRELNQDDKIRVAYVLAAELSQRGFAEKLNETLLPIGWCLDSGRLIPANDDVRELFFPRQSQHDAYTEIRNILQKAKISITIVDPYLDQSILTLLATALTDRMSIRLLSARLPVDFSLEVTKFNTQHQNTRIEVRATKEFHDRFLVLDGEVCWHIGCSIKDAGNKAFMLSKLEDETNRSALVAQIETAWQSGNPHP